MSACRSERSTAAIDSESSRSSVVSEGDAAIGYLHTGEQSCTVGQDVVGADRHALADDRTAEDLAAVADPRAGADDAVAQDTAGPDRGAGEHDAALDGRALPHADVRCEHREAADVGAVGDRAAGADQRRGDRAAVDLRALVDREEVVPQSRRDGGADVALE